jgi:hypothetical protein
MTYLTAEDINILIEALDAWTDKDAVANLMEDIIPIAIARSRQEAESLQTKFSTKQGRAAAKALRKERAIVLQAKLIEMRIRLEAET